MSTQSVFRFQLPTEYEYHFVEYEYEYERRIADIELDHRPFDSIARFVWVDYRKMSRLLPMLEGARSIVRWRLMHPTGRHWFG